MIEIKGLLEKNNGVDISDHASKKYSLRLEIIVDDFVLT
jgi:hypothetical protein